MKFKNFIRILPGSSSCETTIFNGCFLILIFMAFNYFYFFTPSLIFCKSILRFYFDNLFC